MPAPIDLLYRLTDRDKAFPHWGPAFGAVSRSATGNNVDSTLAEWDASASPPPGTILFITNILAAGSPTSGVSLSQLRVRIMNRLTGVEITRILEGAEPIAFPSILNLQSTFDFALPIDRYFLRVSGIFNISNANNNVSMFWSGYTMPVGQIGFI